MDPGDPPIDKLAALPDGEFDAGLELPLFVVAGMRGFETLGKIRRHEDSSGPAVLQRRDILRVSKESHITSTGIGDGGGARNPGLSSRNKLAAHEGGQVLNRQFHGR